MTMTIAARFASALCLFMAGVAHAVTPGEVSRIDAASVAITWSDADRVTVLAASRADASPAEARVVASKLRGGRHVVAAPADQRIYFLLRNEADGTLARLAERELPLEQGSNFRDVGGYATADGKRVRWGKVFRSGAMPLLTEGDMGLLESLGIGTVVDLRSMDERQIAPGMLDDRTGALFVSNDYSLRTLMASMMAGDGENMYRGLPEALAPQYRAIFRRLLADDGAVVYHCSAGQDRTGVATALLLSTLGVPRETILTDYHLSTALRRPQFEMPPLDPADWPGNPIVPFYVAAQKAGSAARAEPLYTLSGQSHLVQFFAQIDAQYGSVDGYLKAVLGLKEEDLARLKALYLE